MDFRKICVVFILLVNHAKPQRLCSKDFNSYDCIYDVVCKQGDEISFRCTDVPFYEEYSDYSSCEHTGIDEYDHNIRLVLEQQTITTETPFNFEDCFLKLIYELDISNNEFRQTPVIRSMENLVKLSITRNHLATAILSNMNELTNLTFFDLSYNEITDILVNKSQCLFKKLQSINLSHNLLVNISDGIFDEFTDLQLLDLSYNYIETLSVLTFSVIKSLKTIHLSNNRIKYIPKGLFANASIHTFSITENALEGSLENGMFKGLSVVTRLDLSHQYLTKIMDYAFYDLNMLNMLFLNSNSIQSLSKMCFKTLIHLQELHLSDNQLTDIDFDKEDLSNLKSLFLNNNRLTEIRYEQLQHLERLKYLDLSHNLISRLESNSFQSLRKLINLEINYNSLVGTLETGTFDGLILLPNLDLSNNILTTIQNASFRNMTKLTELNISNCGISELQYNTFVHTVNINTLDLSYNRLKEFFVNTTELMELSILLLNNNVIKIISSSSLNGLLKLKKIILSHNVIEHIDYKSLNSLINLKDIDLSYNENLNFSTEIVEDTILYSLDLSGIKTGISLAHIKNGSFINTLRIINSNIWNIGEIQLSKGTELEWFYLSHNNISKLFVDDFSDLRVLKHLDLSFNQISYIQPGAFKHNPILSYLNISHNYVTYIGYGVLRGLEGLSILDMSYNSIKDLKGVRFQEVINLSTLIVDFNQIGSINTEQFEVPHQLILSIGDNPLLCQMIVKLAKIGYVHITAIRSVHSDENVDGVSCMSELNVQMNTTNTHQSESTPRNTGHESVTSNGSTNSIVTDTCVALILFILVGLVLYKIYKSRMFGRYRVASNTGELPGRMVNSAL